MICPACREDNAILSIQNEYKLFNDNIIIYDIPRIRCTSSTLYVSSEFVSEYINYYFRKLPRGFRGSYEEACKLALRERNDNNEMSIMQRG